MDGCSFRSRVAKGSLIAQRAGGYASNRSRDDYARRRTERGAGGEERGEESDGTENTLDVQIHDLSESEVRMGVELLSPCCTSVCKEDVYVRRLLLCF